MFYGQSSCVCLMRQSLFGTFPAHGPLKKNTVCFTRWPPKLPSSVSTCISEPRPLGGSRGQSLRGVGFPEGVGSAGWGTNPHVRAQPCACRVGSAPFESFLSDPVPLSVTHTELLFWNFREHNEWTWALCPLRLGCFCRSAPWACEGRCSYVHLGRVARLEPLI